MTLEEKFKTALKKDFDLLYQKEFTTDWKEQRFIRGLEIDAMSFPNLAQIAEEGREVIAEGVLKISANYPYWDRYQIGEIIASDSWLRDKLRKHNSKPVKLTLEVQE